MNRGVSALLGAQFLSAFADNAILFVRDRDRDGDAGGPAG